MNREELTTLSFSTNRSQNLSGSPESLVVFFCLQTNMYSCQGALRKETIEFRMPTNTTKSINQPISLHSGTFWIILAHLKHVETIWNFYLPGFSRGCCLAATGAPGLALIGWMWLASACQWIHYDPLVIFLWAHASLWDKHLAHPWMYLSTWANRGQGCCDEMSVPRTGHRCSQRGQMGFELSLQIWLHASSPQPAASDQSGRAMIPTCAAVVA